jgi:polyhydroxybutyrate depolymerase
MLDFKYKPILWFVAGAVGLLLIIAAGVFWAVGPTTDCVRSEPGPAEEGWSSRTIISGGVERCYVLYVPEIYNPEQPAALVFSFHGFLSNPNSHALISGWHELAEEEGFLVVYPQGTRFPQRWNAGITWGAEEVDDTQFFLDMLDAVSAETSVDKTRVFVTGFSNGGGMAARIGCEASGDVAAIGTVAAAVATKQGCSPSNPVPAMMFHGTSDPVVNYDGGIMNGSILRWAAGVTDAPTYFDAAGDWIAMWAELNGCRLTPEVIHPTGEVSGVHFSGCLNDAEVIFYTIEGGGHTWPGGFPIPVVGKTSHDIDATREMWQFFGGINSDQPMDRARSF